LGVTASYLTGAMTMRCSALVSLALATQTSSTRATAVPVELNRTDRLNDENESVIAQMSRQAVIHG